MKSLLFIPLLLLSLCEEAGGFTPRNNRNSAFFLIRLSSSTHPSEGSDLFFPPPISHENLMRYQQRAAQSAGEEDVIRSNTFDLPQLDDTAAFRLLDSSTVSNSDKKPMPILLPILTFTNAFMLILLIALSSESGNTERPDSVPNKPPNTTIQERRATVIEQDSSWGTDGSAGFFFY